MAMPGNASVHVSAVYTRHRPEQTLLYRIVEEHYGYSMDKAPDPSINLDVATG